MRKGRGKGKISYDLVAASCAAIVAVYAAGYSRTREAARRFETHARVRRAVTPALPAAIRPAPADGVAAPLQATASEPATAPAAAATKPASKARQRVTVRRPAPRSNDVVTAAVSSQEASSPEAPRQIAAIPMPTEDATAAKPIPISREPTSAAVAKWRDGTYTGLGDSPHGDIEARVVISNGRIVEAGILNCDTRYPCDVIDPLIHQPVDRQSPNVDYMSHATESSDAYYDALVAALEKAVEPASSEAAVPK